MCCSHKGHLILVSTSGHGTRLSHWLTDQEGPIIALPCLTEISLSSTPKKSLCMRSWAIGHSFSPPFFLTLCFNSDPRKNFAVGKFRHGCTRQHSSDLLMQWNFASGHTWYMYMTFFFTQLQVEAKKFYTWKCINLWQKLSRNKTVRKLLHCV